MRSMRLALGVAAFAAALLVPPAAQADVLAVLQQLDERRLTPAPLVPTTAPRSLRPLDRTLESATTRRRAGYSLRIATAGADAIVVLEGGQYRSMAALLREMTRRFSFRSRPTRVRNRRGHLLTRRLGPVQRWLAWVEDGRVYSLGTGTARKVSLSELRATATGLDRLVGAFGGSPDPATSTEAFAAVTARTVSARVSWEARCTDPGATESYARVGTAEVSLLRRAGTAFSFDIASNLTEPEGWTGDIGGTVAQDAVALTLRATGTVAGASCDTGPMSFSIPRVRRRG